MNSSVLNVINTSTRSMSDLCRDIKFTIYCVMNNCMVDNSAVNTLTHFRNTSERKKFVQRIKTQLMTTGIISLTDDRKKKDFKLSIEEKAFGIPEIKPNDLFEKSIEEQKSLFSVSEKETDYVTLLCYLNKGVLTTIISIIEDLIDYDGKGIKDFELTYLEAYIEYNNKIKKELSIKEMSSCLINLRESYNGFYQDYVECKTAGIIQELDSFSTSNKKEYPRKMIKDLASVMGFKNESGSLTIDKQHKKHLAKIKEVKTKEELKAVLKKKKYTDKNLLERLLTSEEDRNDSLSVYDNTKENDLTPSHFEFKQVLKLLTAMKEEDLDSISKNNVDIAAQLQLNNNNTIVVPEMGTSPSIADFGFTHGSYNISLEATKITNESNLIRSEIIQCFEHLSDQMKSISLVINNAFSEKFNAYTFEINVGKQFSGDPRRIVSVSGKTYDLIVEKVEKHGINIIKDYYDYLDKRLLIRKDGYPWINEFFEDIK